MKCAEGEKQIDSFIDGELNQSLGDTVKQHLNECATCEKTFASLQSISDILRKDISLPASSRLDGRVMEAFALHHQNKQKKNWRVLVFGQIVIPKPIFALALLAFAVFTGLAFQVGKMSTRDVRTEMAANETAKPSPPASESNLQFESIKETKNKTAAAPVIKYIQVPVVKEKIVTRFIYVNKQPGKENNIKVDSTKSKTNDFALTSSVNENRYLTQVNLKQFQPVAEMKIKITKKDENNEK